MKPGLLLVDVQQDFLQRAELYPDAQTLVHSLENLLGAFRQHGLPVFHSHTLINQDGSNAMPHWRTSTSPMPCIEGSDGAASPQELQARTPEKIFCKQFYSAFEDAGLLADIREKGVDTLVIAGIYTHACVRESALSAYQCGLDVLLPVDGVASYDAEHASHTLAFLHNRAAQCLTIAEIIAALQTLPAIPATTHNTWPQRKPANTLDIIAEVTILDAAAVNTAINAMILPQQQWSTISLHARREKLLPWLHHLQTQHTLWTDALVHEVGKPHKDAVSEINYGLSLLQYTCDTMTDTTATNPGNPQASVVYHPHGIVGVITPWNNPFAIPLSKIMAALAYGNAVAWKPAMHGSKLAKTLHQSMIDHGLGDIVTLLTGDARTGQAVATCPAIRAVSFTGSVAAGQSLAQHCLNSHKAFQAELGGNNAAIVLNDCDQSAVAADLAQAMFSFSGQRCTAVRRVIVEHSIFASFKQALKTAVTALAVGEPSAIETDIGPVISKEVQTRLLGKIAEARQLGATLLTGGDIPPDVSEEVCWIMPTIITDLPPDSAIIHEELFGPVVSLQCAGDLQHALSLANAVPHGLLCAIYTHSESAKKLFLQEAQAGLLTINQARPLFDNALPFGGWKASGIGLPEHGQWDKVFFTQPQAVYHKH